jgi:hypothetical protein
VTLERVLPVQEKSGVSGDVAGRGLPAGCPGHRRPGLLRLEVTNTPKV